MRKLFASRPHFNGFVFQTFPTEKQERKAQFPMLVISSLYHSFRLKSGVKLHKLFHSVIIQFK